MREFEAKDFNDGLRSGLRAFKGNPINKQSLVKAYNVLADETGLIPFEVVTVIATGGWLYSGTKILLHLSASGVLSTVNISTWVLTQVYSFPSAPSRMEVFDAGTFMMISNGEGEYCTRGYTGVYAAATPNSVLDYSYSPNLVFPDFKTICNFRCQPIIGNITAGAAMGTYAGVYQWDDCDENSVAWGGIGKFDFRPDQSNVKGYRRMEWRGQVYKVKVLGNYIVVYGSGGIALLTPVSGSVTTFGYRDLDLPGLLGAQAVGGDDNLHVFISNDNEVIKMGKDMNAQVLGYQEWIEELTANEIRITYDNKKKRFYISDTSKCFVLTKFGMTECYQIVRSAADIEGTMIGIVVADASPDTSLDILTDTLDYGNRALKHIEFLEYGVTGGSGLESYVHWKNDQGSFNNGGDKDINDQGFVSTGITAVDFRLGMKASSYLGVYLSYIKQRVKTVDKRSIRGTYNAD